MAVTVKVTCPATATGDAYVNPRLLFRVESCAKADVAGTGRRSNEMVAETSLAALLGLEDDVIASLVRMTSDGGNVTDVSYEIPESLGKENGNGKILMVFDLAVVDVDDDDKSGTATLDQDGCGPDFLKLGECLRAPVLAARSSSLPYRSGKVRQAPNHIRIHVPNFWISI